MVQKFFAENFVDFFWAVGGCLCLVTTDIKTYIYIRAILLYALSLDKDILE
jgi:hypothetical protein